MRSGATRTGSKRSLRSAGLAVVLIALFGCSSPASPSSGAAVPVTLKDYRISSSVATTPAGMVSFEIHNRGPSTHEFVVFRTDSQADQMPLGEDGITIDEDAPSLRNVGELAQVDIGQSRQMVIRLSPGRYVLVCNMEGHYLGGMHYVLTVH
jgi:uncharacterized cupredoxin-like copper-binding protein